MSDRAAVSERAAVRERLERLFTADIFAREHDTTGPERSQLTYRRLRHLTAGLTAGLATGPGPSPTAGLASGPGVPEPLLTRPELLFPLLEWSAIRDPSLFHALMLHHCMATGAVLTFGGPETGAHLAALASADTVGAVLLTELGHGNSNARVRTRASFDPGRRGFTLTTPEPAAVKCPPTVAADGVARLGIVAAELTVAGRECGSFLFAVPLRDAAGPRPGVRIVPQPETALLPLDYAVVAFDDVELPFSGWLPHTARIDADGAFHDPAGSPEIRRRITLTVTRLAWNAVIAGLAAVARASAGIAIGHAHRRHVVSRLADAPVPTIRLSNQRQTLVRALACAQVATAVAEVARAGADLALQPALLRTTSLRKVTVTALAERAAALSRRSAGAFGFFSANRFIEYQGLAQAYRSAAADNEMLLLEAAWGMLTSGDYRPPEAEPAQPGAPDPLDPGAWRRLAAARERRAHQELERHVTAETQAGASRPEAFDTYAEMACELAMAYAFHDTVRILASALDAVVDPAERRLLADLYGVHVLSELSRDAASWLAADVVPASLLAALPGLVTGLVRRVAPYARDLVTAWEIPAGLSAAVLEEPDYVGAYAAGVRPEPAPDHHA